jgi:cation diffusion facilitator family transporter
MEKHHHDHHHSNDHKHCTHQLNLKKKKTGWVLLISLVTMLLEISFGYFTHSMALLSDGWHMTSHVVAIGAGWLAYQYVLSRNKKGNAANTSKILAYVGFFNALALAVIAVMVFIESIERFCNPINIRYNEAIVVAVIGLIVNVVSAKILHHDEEHTDHNLKAAYLHVLADVLTSVLALLALFAGLYFQLNKADSFVGIIGSIVILNWARGIIMHSGKEIFKKSNHDNNK